MREKLMRFMQGRYGVDSLSRCLLWIGIVSMLISMFIRQGLLYRIFNWGSLLCLIICYARMFSRNYSKRYAENQLFLQKTARLRRFLAQQKKLMVQRKTHRIYTCPGCKQKIRVPKGRGRIEISCPKCYTKFIKRS